MDVVVVVVLPYVMERTTTCVCQLLDANEAPMGEVRHKRTFLTETKLEPRHDSPPTTPCIASTFFFRRRHRDAPHRFGPLLFTSFIPYISYSPRREPPTQRTRWAFVDLMIRSYHHTHRHIDGATSQIRPTTRHSPPHEKDPEEHVTLPSSSSRPPPTLTEYTWVMGNSSRFTSPRCSSEAINNRIQYEKSHVHNGAKPLPANPETPPAERRTHEAKQKPCRRSTVPTCCSQEFP